MQGDVREFPRYSIPEAAFYVRIPANTLRAWTLGQDYITHTGVHRTFKPLIELADKKNKLLSYQLGIIRSINAPKSGTVNAVSP
jgi:hypothetical protein